MTYVAICQKCGAPVENTKCQFCGSPAIQQTQSGDLSNASNEKLIAEREFKTQNYSAALKEYEGFYKKNPNDPYTIVRRAYCLYELEKIDLSQFVNYLGQAIDLSKSETFQRFVIEEFIIANTYKFEEQNIESIGLFHRFDKLCGHRKELIDFLIDTLINSIEDADDLILVLLYDSISLLARPITLGEGGKVGFEDKMEFYLIKNLIIKLDAVKKEKWHLGVYDFEDAEVPCPDYGDIDLAPLYIIQSIESSFVGKIAYKYVDGYFSKSHRWSDEEWVEKINKIPKDINNMYIINVLNEQVNRILTDNEKTYKYIFPDGIKKAGIGVGGKSSCFIATATMGSYDHPVVMDLRLFRDNWLLKRDWGVTFTKWYYIHGPKAARVIEKSKLLQMVTFLFVVKPLQILTKLLK